MNLLFHYEVVRVSDDDTDWPFAVMSVFGKHHRIMSRHADEAMAIERCEELNKLVRYARSRPLHPSLKGYA
jgi:hypothetical protein